MLAMLLPREYLPIISCSRAVTPYFSQSDASALSVWFRRRIRPYRLNHSQPLSRLSLFFEQGVELGNRGDNEYEHKNKRERHKGKLIEGEVLEEEETDHVSDCKHD